MSAVIVYVLLLFIFHIWYNHKNNKFNILFPTAEFPITVKIE